MIIKFLPALLLAITGALPAFSNETDSSFTIKGYLAGEQQANKIFIRYNQHVDSAVLKNGHFEFKGFVSQPVLASIWCEVKSDPSAFNNNSRSFYLEPASLLITSFESLQKAVVTGGRTEAEQQVWSKLAEPVQKKYGDLTSRKYLNRENPDSVKALIKEMTQVEKERTKLEIQFITRFPASYVSWDLMQGNSYGIDPAVLGPMLDALDPMFKKTPEAKDIAERLAIAKQTWIGMPALEFTQPDVNGKPVSLSSFRGKYVLVDFWASWCGWCRLEHPNMLKVYDAYKGKGFTVLGVSLDDSTQKEKWLAAIKEDKLPWQQVCDLKGRNNEAVKLYGIKGIPQNVLIDPNGIIVAKNLRGDNLLIKLEELMGK